MSEQKKLIWKMIKLKDFEWCGLDLKWFWMILTLADTCSLLSGPSVPFRCSVWTSYLLFSLLPGVMMLWGYWVYSCLFSLHPAYHSSQGRRIVISPQRDNSTRSCIIASSHCVALLSDWLRGSSLGCNKLIRLKCTGGQHQTHRWAISQSDAFPDCVLMEFYWALRF